MYISALSDAISTGISKILSVSNIIPITLGSLLSVSEIMPFIKSSKANGIIHFIIKSIILEIDEELSDENRPLIENNQNDTSTQINQDNKKNKTDTSTQINQDNKCHEDEKSSSSKQGESSCIIDVEHNKASSSSSLSSLSIPLELSNKIDNMYNLQEELKNYIRNDIRNDIRNCIVLDSQNVCDINIKTRDIAELSEMMLQHLQELQRKYNENNELSDLKQNEFKDYFIKTLSMFFENNNTIGRDDIDNLDNKISDINKLLNNLSNDINTSILNDKIDKVSNDTTLHILSMTEQLNSITETIQKMHNKMNIAMTKRNKLNIFSKFENNRTN